MTAVPGSQREQATHVKDITILVMYTEGKTLDVCIGRCHVSVILALEQLEAGGSPSSRLPFEANRNYMRPFLKKQNRLV